MPKPIYMDYQATTPVDPAVLEAMLPWFTEQFGNASSGHSFGWLAKEAVEQARGQIAEALGAGPREILFTSGATESDNLAIKGVAEMYESRGRHLISAPTEHKAVLDTCLALEKRGWELTLLQTDIDGMIDLEELRKAIREDTVLVSLMAVNNEIGVIHPLEAIGAITREKGTLFHVDAAQGFGKIPLDVDRMNIDLLSLSGHKIYGPKGVGVLYVRGRNPRVRLSVQMHGGEQEGGFRSGTLDVPGIVGLAEATRLCLEEMESETERLRALRNRFLERVLSELDDVHLNGHSEERVAGNLNLSFGKVQGDALLMGLRGVAVSSGSACVSTNVGPSYILQAIGRETDLARSSLRIGFGRYSTEEEADEVCARLIETVQKLRSSRMGGQTESEE
ncbi:MAG: IscS subfamily cysteine desulfurase [Candidatus Krumholzibacteria bacterium]|jgi:cysteine desulfurase|nr:IscS subfamily cysteine desulfurase [Candidatus Krumholzibacteria bacterium]MDP6668478.1 IscS subfamily cysteine desulfurase [Candidatus Krumholzibacteria bacterium]MDP6797372.1 IscS subfamily cysteine desulfurase [Candidatus Krumholzibacteria bacterium]MDP7021571.1 IscS subfamily cysteine desulfurase [Candidatus Krumholzibacteria bacterium]